jgi:hypothetical protein
MEPDVHVARVVAIVDDEHERSGRPVPGRTAPVRHRRSPMLMRGALRGKCILEIEAAPMNQQLAGLLLKPVPVRMLVLFADYWEKAHYRHRDPPDHIQRHGEKREQSDNGHETAEYL